MNLYPTILKKIIFPCTDKAIGTTYSHYIKQFSKLDLASRDEIILWQNKKLQILITHVYQNVPFYTEYMNNNNISPSDIRSAEDLDKFPPLDKSTIKSNFDKFIPKNINEIKYSIAATGGSTGEPLKYYLSNETQSAMWAKRICVLKKYGFQVGEKYLAMGSSSIIPNAKASKKSTLFHQLLRMIPLSAANMDANKCKEAITLLKQHKIKMIYGYASSVFLLAKYILENNIKTPLRVCITTSEKLTEYYEKTIKEAFSCPVINEYGAREGGLYSYRCEQGNFHMIESCLYRIDGETKTGLILATNLINYAMPFINYNVEDIITLREEICECGSNSFIFGDVVGRESQIMTLGNGRTVTGPAFTVLFSKLPVKCYQIVKTGDCAIELRIQKGKDYSKETEQLILQSLKTHAGEDCSIVFNYKHNFIPLKNGKLDYFVTN